MLRSLSDVANEIREAIEPLWVGGLALLQLILVRRCLHLSGERLEWAEYLLYGTLFPLLVLILSWLVRRAPRWFTPPSLLKLALALCCPVIIGYYLFRDLRALFMLLGLAQSVALLIWDRTAAPESGGTSFPRRLARYLVIFGVGGLAWVVVIRFQWWQPFHSWISGSWFTHDVFLLSLLLVLVNLCRREPAGPASRGWLSWIVNGVALLLLALASVRVRPLCVVACHHWGVHVGPAELVRQGGWLLWDVPFQYGFLNTLLLSWMPTDNVWQSFYILHALVQFLSAGFLFLLLRSLRPGPLNCCFALLVAVAGVLMMPGAPQMLLDGPFPVPNTGPFRFCWCYALLAVLVGEHRAAQESPGRRGWLWAGCAVWLVGALWSCESGAFCTAVWLPAYLLLVLRRVTALYPGRERRKERVRAAVSWLMIPPTFVALTAGLISAYYFVRLGHAPDWRGYFEYVRSESAEGFAALPIDRDGAVWTLLLVLCALSTVAAGFLWRGPLLALPAPLVGAWGAVWATVSYFIGSSHESRATSMAPTLCMGIAVALYLLARRRVTDSFSTLAKVSFVPVLTVILTITFGYREGLVHFLTLAKGGYTGHIDRRLPLMEPALLQLLEQAEVKDDDPFLYTDCLGNPLPARLGRDGRLLCSAPAWVPTVPLALIMPLSPERSGVYMDRFTSRVHRSGWFAYPRKAPPLALPWFQEYLTRTHVLSRTYENAAWRLCWYEYRGPGPGADVRASAARGAGD